MKIVLNIIELLFAICDLIISIKKIREWYK